MGLITALMIAVQPVSAKRNPVFRSNGKFDHYNDWEDLARSSEIIGGSWRVTVKDGMAMFSGSYREMNIREEVEMSPAGTVDIFVLTLESEDYWFEGDELVIQGSMHCRKRMWFLDDYTPYEPLPDWFNPDWVPKHRNVAWIRDFPLFDYVEIRISPAGITWSGTLNAFGTTYHFRLPELTFYDPVMWSNTQYNLEDQTDIWYGIVEWVSVYSKDGLDDIEYVKLIFPDGVTEADMPYEEETGRYYSSVFLDAPVTGTFTFEAKDYSGNVAQLEYTIGDWAEPYYEYVKPDPGQVYPTSDTLVFEWGLDQPEVIDYNVNIWDNSGFWYDGWSDDSPHQYDGPPLAEGEYRFGITACRLPPDGQLTAHGYIYIGSSTSP